MHDPNSLLWLYGIPGCGKTVLCSTAIERVLQFHNTATQKRVGIAYFYFDFRHQDQQVCDAMLRSLVAQLSLQSLDAFKLLDALYSACGSGTSQPSLPMTLKALKDIAESFAEVFVLVDALDECKEPAELLANVESLVKSNITSLHMLVTSRREKEIEESMSTLLNDEHKFCIQSTLVEDDIRAYVQGRTCKDRRLKKWQKPEIQAEITEVLVEKADGMFQWVKCQLDALGKCLSVSDLRQSLRSLPRDLDDTYARILQDIDSKGYGDQFAKILQWLAYSARTLSLKEMAEVLTVDMERDPMVDFERRPEDPQEVLELCSSLISIVAGNTDNRHVPDTEYLQFAHFSVREFLMSPRLDNGPARKFAVDKMRANILIAESCIAYIIRLDSVKVNSDDWTVYEKYPLSRYAADHWHIHVKNARENGRIISLLGRLFRSWSTTSELPSWLGTLTFFPELYTDARSRFLPLHCPIVLRLPRFMRKLIVEGADVNSKNEVWGQTPLMCMLNLFPELDTHERVENVQHLLNHGADIHARDKYGSTALTLASKQGCVQTVQILLDNGADISARDGEGSTTLILASEIELHEEKLETKVERKYKTVHDDVDHPRNQLLSVFEQTYVSRKQTLQKTQTTRTLQTLQTLLNNGANVNARDELIARGELIARNEHGSTALVCASEHTDVLTEQRLLEIGAGVNAPDVIGSNVLIRSFEHECAQTVKALPDNSADLDAYKGEGSAALVAAASHGHTEIVHLLLHRGASIESPIGAIALRVASGRGYSEIAQSLLDRGVDVDGNCDLINSLGDTLFSYTALVQALAGQRYGTAELLVKNGANVNARSFMVDRDAVLLEHVIVFSRNLYWKNGLSIGTRLEEYPADGILEDGVKKRRDEMLWFLLDNGADPKLVHTEKLGPQAKEGYDELLKDWESERLGCMD
ncbi:ankyrin repeat-containing domain protein [Usnea florida]